MQKRVESGSIVDGRGGIKPDIIWQEGSNQAKIQELLEAVAGRGNNQAKILSTQVGLLCIQKSQIRLDLAYYLIRLFCPDTGLNPLLLEILHNLQH